MSFADERPEVSKMRVLVVEDDRDALDLLENALSYFGYEVTTASDGARALDEIRTGQYRIAPATSSSSSRATRLSSATGATPPRSRYELRAERPGANARS